jgi:hypothetical protein
MRVLARELAVGDVIRLNDWRLHVVAVEHDIATAVATAEFDFLLHFTRTDPVDLSAMSTTHPPQHDAGGARVRRTRLP